MTSLATLQGGSDKVGCEVRVMVTRSGVRVRVREWVTRSGVRVRVREWVARSV